MGFKESLLAQIEENFKEITNASSKEEIIVRIDTAIEKAKSYNIVSENDVTGFVFMTFRLGEDFDVNPELPFADMILEQRMVYEREPTLKRFQKTALMSLLNKKK